MKRVGIGLGVLCAVWAWLSGLPVLAQPAPIPLDRLLAMPLGPGPIGLLVEHAGPAVRERLAAALADPNPQTRAAAARVTFVRGVVELRPAVIQALALETDRGAVREMLLAAAGLAADQDLGVMVTAAKRLGGDLPEVLGEQLGRSSGPWACSVLPTLRALGLDTAGRRRFLAAATRAGKEGLSECDQPALTNDADWSSVLELHRSAEQPIDASLLRSSLSAEAAIRSATHWHLALTCRPQQACPLDLADLEPPPDESPDASDEAASNRGAGAVLARRALGAPAAGEEELTGYLRRHGPARGRVFYFPRLRAVADLLTRSERRAAKPFLGESLPRHERERPPVQRDLTSPRLDPRTLLGLPPGFLPEVVKAAGCKLSASAGITSGSLRFLPDGRPTGVSIPAGTPPDGCGSALRTLLAASLAPMGQVIEAGRVDHVVVSFHPDAVGCAPETAASLEAPLSDLLGPNPPQSPEPPRILSRRSPIYPDPAVWERTTGLVTVEGVLTSAGCITEAGVEHGAHPLLDLSALHSVLSWRFRPARLGGKPIATRYRVVVNFRINVG